MLQFVGDAGYLIAGTNFLKAKFIFIVFPWDVWPKDYKSKYDSK